MPNLTAGDSLYKQPEMSYLVSVSFSSTFRTEETTAISKMKMFIVLALATLAVAAPQRSASDEVVVVKETLHNNIGVDGYNFEYELSDNQKRQESAELQNAGTEDEALVVRGSFSYVDPVSGQEYKITYVADKDGYRPEGAHIPV